VSGNVGWQVLIPFPIPDRLVPGHARYHRAEKLAVAKDFGADHVMSTKGKSLDDIRKELFKATSKAKVDAVNRLRGS
jgi:hypothetical protein